MQLVANISYEIVLLYIKLFPHPVGWFFNLLMSDFVMWCDLVTCVEHKFQKLFYIYESVPKKGEMICHRIIPPPVAPSEKEF